MLKADFNFYQNTDCRYFPCHGTRKGTGAIPVEDFNCYCPLMFIPCSGNYKLLESGFKDCSACTRNHDKNSWRFVVARLREHMQVKVKFSRIDIIGGDGEHYD